MSNSKKRQHESVDYIKQHKEKVPAGGEEASITQGLQDVHLVDAAAAAAYEAAKKKLAHKASFTEVGSDVEAALLPPGVAWRVDVVRWKIAQDNASRQFATYLLKVSSDTPVARTWYLYRRYNDFSTLKAELKKAGCTLSTLPSKGVFTFGSHLGADFLNKRRDELQAWCQQLPEVLTKFGAGAGAAASTKACELVVSYVTQGAVMAAGGGGAGGAGGRGGGGGGAAPSGIAAELGAAAAGERGPLTLAPSAEAWDPLARSGSGGTGGARSSSSADSSGGSVGSAGAGGDGSGGSGGSSSGGGGGGRPIGIPGRGSASDARPINPVKISDFEAVSVLGKGSFGKVLLVRKRDTNRLYAMKVLKKQYVIKKRQVEHTKTERSVLGSVQHPFIVKLHFAFQTGDKLHLVLDYCSGGELFFHLQNKGRFLQPLALFYTAELALALGALHSAGVVFRDLKPENILLDEVGHIKLADFGLSKEGIQDQAAGTRSFCGTPEYLAPEILLRQGHGKAVDWWSLGALLYEMLTGLPPWYSRDRNKMFASIRSAPLQ
eukprot:g4623.t1